MKNIQRAVLVLSIMFLALPVALNQVQARNNDHSSVFTVEIMSDDDGVLTKYAAGSGSQRTRKSYVIAHNNERYSIHVHNRSNSKIGLVITVDGRNIISGNKSHLKPSERMYILEPYQSDNYEGWRTSRNEVNRFYFTGMSDSYSASWGDYSAMGVIAVAAYKGRQQYTFGHKGDRDKTRPLDQPRANSRKENPGTGFGEGEWSPSHTVYFSPQNKPVAKEFIKYEWRSTLCTKKILRCRTKRMPTKENRFWSDPFHNDGFAPFPNRVPWPHG